MTQRLDSHFSGSALDATVGHQSPVVPLAGAECALPGFLVDLHLKRLHVCLIVLIGCKTHSWERHSEHTWQMWMSASAQLFTRLFYPKACFFTLGMFYFIRVECTECRTEKMSQRKQQKHM